jgi:allantoinase
MAAMKPNERTPFSAIDDRPPLRLPSGDRLIIWPLMSLEVWNIDRAMARTILPPPQHQTLIPDIPNWSWHEYGMRVGFWRLRKLFAELNLTGTVTMNGRVCAEYPRVVEACLELGWECNAHAFEQIPMHNVENQEENIRKTVNAIEEFTGYRPRGWFGPGLTETFETLDYLKKAGFEYIGDWAFDDQPVPLKTEHGEIISLPYNFEIHDIVVSLIQNQRSHVYKERAIDYFDTLYEEASGSVRIMSFAVHPYISGSPHRIRYVRELLEYMLEKPGVVVMTGEQILDWYMSEKT